MPGSGFSAEGGEGGNEGEHASRGDVVNLGLICLMGTVILEGIPATSRIAGAADGGGLDGLDASAFLGTGATAANPNRLGGNTAQEIIDRPSRVPGHIAATLAISPAGADATQVVCRAGPPEIDCRHVRVKDTDGNHAEPIEIAVLLVEATIPGRTLSPQAPIWPSNGR